MAGKLVKENLIGRRSLQVERQRCWVSKTRSGLGRSAKKKGEILVVQAWSLRVEYQTRKVWVNNTNNGEQPDTWSKQKKKNSVLKTRWLDLKLFSKKHVKQRLSTQKKGVSKTLHS